MSIIPQSFNVLNLKLQVKVTFKTFSWLLELLYTAFVLKATTKVAWFAQNFAVCGSCGSSLASLEADSPKHKSFW